MARQERLIYVYDENDELMFRGSLNKASQVMKVSRQHVYDVLNGITGLSVDSPAHYFVENNNVYNKREKGQKYVVGYQFNILDNPVIITEVKHDVDNELYIYEFNGIVRHGVRREITDFNILYNLAKRLLDL